MRSIRLKEHVPNTVKVRVPDEGEFAGYNGTIENKEYVLKIDGNGFVASRHAGKLKDARKVVLLGDSFFECAFVDDGKRVADICNKMSLRKEGGVNFINAGYAAATAMNSFMSYAAKIMPLRPNAVYFSADTFDVSCWQDERSYWMPHPWFSTTLPADRNYRARRGPSSGKEDFEAILEGLFAMCRQSNTKLVLITKPICPESAWSASRQKYYEAKTSALREYNDVVRSYCNRKNRLLLDIDADCKLEWDDFYDANHLNQKGARKVARAIYSYETKKKAAEKPSSGLLRRFWFNRSRTGPA
ncbi:SGNH/GDSL hydrolase family protein (plasmid) [Limimaricola variabilis]|uniref:SGNH/GDSL hydrolase family protein n=1 Tax=Limimaricola variabilis TaxID=1492771 RepID=UPI002AC9C2A7|nr:SGNH/GDSL hydrolase family protein [Limimaricola variabilis]WPY97045.1 SGNH/GDSL hydrolase family protein [Limimaricola variabilis]